MGVQRKKLKFCKITINYTLSMGVHGNDDRSSKKINLLHFLHSMKKFLYSNMVVRQR